MALACTLAIQFQAGLATGPELQSAGPQMVAMVLKLACHVALSKPSSVSQSVVTQKVTYFKKCISYQRSCWTAEISICK